MALDPKKIIKIQCKVCNKIIFSTYSGQFVTCDCDKNHYIFIDQTEHYCRIGGEQSQYVILKDLEEKKNEI